jgi:Flp pilus assembly protein TadD
MNRSGGMFVIALFLTLLVTVAYANCLTLGFAFDDEIMITENLLIRKLDSIPQLVTSDYWAGRRAPSEAQPWRSGLYRPLILITFALNYAWGQLSPVGYHLVNLLLHLFVTWMVYLLAREIGVGLAGGTVAAALFAVHPLHTEAVIPIVGRAELLMAGGLLAATWLAAKGRIWWSLLAFGGALLSKEQAVVLPGVLLLYDWGITRRVTLWWNWKRWTFFLVLLGYVLARTVALGHVERIPIPFIDNPLAHVDTATRLLTALKVAGFYLWLFIWPTSLSADYSYNAIPLSSSFNDPAVFAALSAWTCLLGLACWSFAGGDRRIAFAVGLLLITFLPASNLIVPIGTIMGERLFYLPSAGLCLLAGVAYESVRRATYDVRLAVIPAQAGIHPDGPPITNVGGDGSIASRITYHVLPFMVALACLALVLRTIERNRDWMSTETLMASAQRAVPSSAKVHTALGQLAVKQADWPAALAHFQTAIGLYPEYTNAEVTINLGLGKVFLNAGPAEAAIAAYERAVKLDPYASTPYLHLAAGYAKAQRYAEAEAAAKVAVALNPEYAEAHSALSWIFSMQGRYQEALDEADLSLRLGPDNLDTRMNRGRALQGLGRSTEARSEFERAGGGSVEPGFIGRKAP